MQRRFLVSDTLQKDVNAYVKAGFHPTMAEGWENLKDSTAFLSIFCVLLCVNLLSNESQFVGQL